MLSIVWEFSEGVRNTMHTHMEENEDTESDIDTTFNLLYPRIQLLSGHMSANINKAPIGESHMVPKCSYTENWDRTVLHSLSLSSK